jgi:hypothetical protein
MHSIPCVARRIVDKGQSHVDACGMGVKNSFFVDKWMTP